jgi:alkylhydroperoxidase family enzyme
MHLEALKRCAGHGNRAAAIRQMEESGAPVPGILRLFAYKPDQTRLLSAFTQAVMRGPSPLSPGERELIAAMTSSQNQCVF